MDVNQSTPNVDEFADDNSVTDNDDFLSGLFDDDGDDESEQDGADATENTNEGATEDNADGLSNDDNAENGDEQKYQVKYNGEFQELPLSELIKNAQKGMNYDKVLSERDSLKASKHFSIIDKLARQNGLSVDEYLNAIEQNLEKTEIENTTPENVPFDVKQKLYQLERENQQLKEKEAQSNAEMQQRQEYLNFVKVYPNVSEIPQEVVRDVAGGMSLMSAYMKYENAQLKTQLSTIQTNQNNKKKALGSLSNDAGTTNSGGMTSIIDNVFN